jgi:hypothetical protein
MTVDTSVWIGYFTVFPSRESDRLAAAIAEGEAIALPGLLRT